MRKKKKYVFTSWANWDDILADAVKDFYATKLVYPNIMLSNDFTYSQIDYITNIDKEKSKNAQLILDDDWDNLMDVISTEKSEINLNSYSYKGSDIVFAVDNKLKDKIFFLINDESPDWGDDNEVNNPLKSQDVKFKCLK